RMAELDERDHQLEQRLAELRDELAAVQRETVSAATIQRAVALFDPVWDLLLVPERFPHPAPRVCRPTTALRARFSESTSWSSHTTRTGRRLAAHPFACPQMGVLACTASAYAVPRQ